MGTFNANILPATTGLNLGSQSQQWNAYINGLFVTGTASLPGEGFVSVAYSSTPVFDGHLGNIFEITLTGNVTAPTIPNLLSGLSYTFIIIQDLIGGRTFAWPGIVSGGMIIDPAPSAVNVQEFIYDGVTLLAASEGVSGQTSRPSNIATTDSTKTNSFVGPISLTNSGVFTDTQMNEYLTSNINGVNFTTEFQTTQGLHGNTEAITGGVVASVSSTVEVASGVAGYAVNQGVATSIVGVYGQAAAGIAGSKAWGANFIGDDRGFNTPNLVGVEVDIRSLNPASIGAGLTFTGTLQPGNLFSAIQVSPASLPAPGIPWQQGLSFFTPTSDGTLNAATFGIDFQTGATVAPTGAGAAIIFNPTASSPGHASQGMTFVSTDPSTGNNLASFSLQANGSMVITTSKPGAGLLINGGAIVTESTSADFTLQTQAIASGPLFFPAVNGQYRLSWNAKVTVVAGTSSTLGPLTVFYTDPDGTFQTITAAAQTSAGAIATTSGGNSTTTVLLGMPLLLNCKGSTIINYSFGYASSPSNVMTYNLHIKLEAM